jgi:hypothetical protein
MFKNKMLTRFFFAICITVMLTSSVPISESKKNDLTTKTEKASFLINEATKDGKSLTSKELMKIAAEVKGKNLSFKDKIALKLFSKKAITAANSSNDSGGKSQVIALILVLLVGVLGIHRFYLGYTWQGVVQLLTGGGCGIWALIDLIRIITGDLKPKDGSYGTTL